MVAVRRVRVRSLISETKLGSDFVINPYIGCPHKCVYCYAACIERGRAPHEVPWGEYLDVKVPTTILPLAKLFRKSVLLSSMTDAYNPYEKRAEVTRAILKQLVPAETSISIITKSALVTRDIDILTQFPRAKVIFSMSSLDDSFRRRAEPYASSPQCKIEAMEKLKAAGISVCAFVAPTFPEITQPEEIVRILGHVADKINFDKLNLRSGNRDKVLRFAAELRPDLAPLYEDIYIRGNNYYWIGLKKRVKEACMREHMACGVFY